MKYKDDVTPAQDSLALLSFFFVFPIVIET